MPPGEKAAEKVDKQIPRRPEGLLGMTNNGRLVGTTEVVPCYKAGAERGPALPEPLFRKGPLAQIAKARSGKHGREFITPFRSLLFAITVRAT